MELKFIYFIVTGAFSILVVLAWYFIKKYINGLSSQISVLFKKIEDLLINLQIVDKVIAINEEKLSALIDRIHELELESKNNIQKINEIDKEVSNIITSMKSKK